jgi:hypothetical protein
MSTPLQNSISSRIFLQNAQFHVYTSTSRHQKGCTCKYSHPVFYNDKFHREVSPGELRWIFGIVFPSFSPVFPLKFTYTGHTYILFISTEISPQTLLDMQGVNKTRIEDSLCKTFNPKCFITTNFDRFRQAAKFQLCNRQTINNACVRRAASSYVSRPPINSCSCESSHRQALQS